MTNPSRPLLLASTSRYRRALLERLKLPFEVVTPGVEESTLPGERPAATAMRLAEAKARAVAATRPGTLVIGSDQVADCDGVAVSKPETHANAVAQLTAQSGRTIVFHTALALVDAASGRCRNALVDVTSVFRRLEQAEIERYLALERPYDCAGAVRSEGSGIALFERIDSDDPTALIGLPLIVLCRLLREEGFAIPGDAPA